MVCTGVDAGAVIPATIGSFFVDRFFFGGRVFDQIARVVIPKYKVRGHARIQNPSPTLIMYSRLK